MRIPCEFCLESYEWNPAGVMLNTPFTLKCTVCGAETTGVFALEDEEAN